VVNQTKKTASRRSEKPAQEHHKPSPVLWLGLPRHSGDHSSRPAVTDRLKQPTRRSQAGTLKHLAIWPCSGWGLPGHPCLQRCRCALTAPFQPYRSSEEKPDCLQTATKRMGLKPNRTRRWRSTLCCTCLRVTPTGRYPASCPTELGLSSRHRGDRRSPVVLEQNKAMLLRAVRPTQD
jgi:hypothetical protein